MMGSRSAKPSPTLTQTLVPPPEPVTPPTTSLQGAGCPITTPTVSPIRTTTVSHAEWDECMRKSALTIGSTTAAAIAVGLMVPAADTLLILGTGAGVLWSVQRCRTIMRDGLLSPEQAKALELRKRTEREEKRRQRKMEKEAKQRAAAERKLQEKQQKLENKKSGSKECCENIKKILEQKGISVQDVPCEKLSHTNEGPKLNVEKALAIRSQFSDNLVPQGRTLQEDHPTIQKGSAGKVNDTKGDVVSNRILTENPEVKSPRPLKKSVLKKQAKTLVKKSHTDPYSSVKLFAPYMRYLSESVILTSDSTECTCNSEKDDSNCTCDPKQLSYGEPQQYTLATDAENEDPQVKEEDSADLTVQQVNSISTDMAELERNSEVQVAAHGARAGDRLDSKNDVVEQHVKEEDQITKQDDEEEEEELVVLSPAFDSTESLKEGISAKLIVEDNEDPNIKTEESLDGFDVEIIKNDIGDEKIEQLKNEVEDASAETYQSESWPFSFSLPSLDKFSKKRNNSFKWPPLTSSIIVKPKKETTCKCPDGSEATKENENAHKSSTCGKSKNGCTSP